MSTQEHWDKDYKNKEVNQLGWYQDKPEPSLNTIKEIPLSTSDRIFVAGAGASTFIDFLHEMGYSNLILNDISSVGIFKIEERTGKQYEKIIGDLSDTSLMKEMKKVDFWHDRAVLHFLTEPKDQRGYVENLRSIVKVGGNVMIATFSLEGAEKCSGLPVHRYSKDMLVQLLGEDFELVKSFNYLYTMPNGNTRPYVYTLFKKIQ